MKWGYPVYSLSQIQMAQEAIEPYILNNISVKILSFNTVDRSFQIKIDLTTMKYALQLADIQLVKQRDDNEADVIFKTEKYA